MTIVVQRYYNELVGFFSRSLRDRDAAFDLVHECYARVLAMENNSSVSEPRALLYRIGKNLITDGVRRKEAEAQVLATLALVAADEYPSVESQVSSRQQLDQLMGRLAVMPRKRRDAFVLVRLYGFSHAEAAAHLGSTETAVEKHIVRSVMDCLDLASARFGLSP